MIHHRQGLSLAVEARDHRVGVHAKLDDLERNGSTNRPFLLGLKDDAEPAFAEFLNQLISPDVRTGSFADGGADRPAKRGHIDVPLGLARPSNVSPPGSCGSFGRSMCI